MGDFGLHGINDGRRYVFDAGVLDMAAAEIRQSIGGDPVAITDALVEAIVPVGAWGDIPNGAVVVEQLRTYVVDVSAGAWAVPGLAAELAARALAAGRIVADADAATSHAAGQLA